MEKMVTTEKMSGSRGRGKSVERYEHLHQMNKCMMMKSLTSTARNVL